LRTAGPCKTDPVTLRIRSGAGPADASAENVCEWSSQLAAMTAIAVTAEEVYTNTTYQR
jgi:hypothetical protein